MGLTDSIRVGAAGAADDYEIERSLRFNAGDSPNMHREGGSDGNRRTFTVSVWMKRQERAEHSWWDFYTDDANRTIFQLYFGYLRLFSRVGNSTQCSLNTDSNMELRDFSAWYHFIYAVDTTQSTEANRVKMYINGEQQTVSGSFPSQNAEMFVGSNNENRIGCQHDSAGNEAFFDGYMAEFNYIDGSQLTPSDFAKTDAVTGQYNPIKYTGSYGTKGYYINFSDNSSTSALGTDFSGNGNNFTSVSGFSLSAGTGYDSYEDTPTNNFPTFDPNLAQAQHGGPTSFSNGNLDATTVAGVGQYPFVFGTFGARSGKWYAEITTRSSTNAAGVANIAYLDSDGTSNPYGGYAVTSIIYTSRGEVRTNNGNQSGGPTYGNGVVIGIALDLDNNKVYFAKNNTYINSGNPSAGSNGYTLGSMPTGKTGDFVFTAGVDGATDNSNISLNCGQRAFSYTPPTGFEKLCTANLPDPTIPDGSKYFGDLFYTGNGSSSHAITGLNFSPDWVWIKVRNATGSHPIFDTVRGATKRLGNSAAGVGTTGESTVADSLKSFDSNGFTFGNEAGNNNGENYAAWCWNAGDSTVTNNDGSVSAQVRASTTAGFSIITWTGTGSNLTIGHGLGVKPNFHITKARSGQSVSEGCSWFVYSEILGATHNLRLNTTATSSSASDLYNNTEPTSSVITIGNSVCINASGGTYVTYAFSEVPGFSAFNCYTGRDADDGPLVNTGFRPKFVIIKCTSNTEHWNIPVFTFENTNSGVKFLSSNLNNAERNMDDNPGIEFYANGFKIRTSDGNLNRSNGFQNFVYFAFAETPFKYARAR